MAKGLDKILKKISENPRQTLVGRYLSLIADIPNEEERAGHALDLAETILKSKPNDALKIAYMIYGSGRHLVRSLRLVISCFEAKGRAGKVAVLKMELEKLTKELAEETEEDSKQRIKPLPDINFNPPPPAPAFSMNDLSAAKGVPAQRHEDTRMAELDLGDFQDEVSASHPVDFLFPDKRPSGIFSLEDDEPSGPELNIAEGFFAGFSGRPGDTVLPVMPSRFDGREDKDRSGTMVSNIILPDAAGHIGKTVNLKDMPRVTLDEPAAPLRTEEPMRELEWRMPSLAELSERQQKADVSERPARSNHQLSQQRPSQAKTSPPGPVPSAPSEVFDRFFNSKKYAEAEAILEHTKMDRTFDWWRSRLKKLQAVDAVDYKFGLSAFIEMETAQDEFVSLQLDESRVGPVVKETSPALAGRTSPSLNSSQIASKSYDDSLKPFSGDLRRAMITEILAISDQAPEASLSHPRIDAGKGTVSKGLLKTLEALPVVSEEDASRLFDLFQSLFVGGHGPGLVRLLEEKQLSRRSPGWFGFYLDALVSSGYGRKVIAESVLVSEQHPTLSWIKVIWRRLEPAWRQMGIEGFHWTEDDGVKDFLSKINQRGRQRLETFVISGSTRPDAKR